MCGRYWFDDGRDDIELQGIIDQVNRSPAEGVKTSGEVLPSDLVPVLSSSRAMRPNVFAMRWGYALPDGRRIINARSETADQKPLFRDGMLQRRCAVPASRYFEWQRTGKSRAKYAIWPEEGGLFYMAGLYRVMDGRPEFCILTRSPAEGIAFIHDRMPVILPKDDIKAWIDPRSDGKSLLERAVLSVACQAVDGPIPEQLAMEL